MWFSSQTPHSCNLLLAPQGVFTFWWPGKLVKSPHSARVPVRGQSRALGPHPSSRGTQGVVRTSVGAGSWREMASPFQQWSPFTGVTHSHLHQQSQERQKTQIKWPCTARA